MRNLPKYFLKDRALRLAGHEYVDYSISFFSVVWQPFTSIFENYPNETTFRQQPQSVGMPAKNKYKGKGAGESEKELPIILPTSPIRIPSGGLL